jgi:hypothetical protein
MPTAGTAQEHEPVVMRWIKAKNKASWTPCCMSQIWFLSTSVVFVSIILQNETIAIGA